jgi:hypothetical protein
VGERKLAAVMKKMKESGKLDINKGLTNHSTRKYLLQRLRENNVEGTAEFVYESSSGMVLGAK